MRACLFEAELNDFKMVYNVLKSVLFKEVGYVHCFAAFIYK